MKRRVGHWKYIVEKLALSNPNILCGLFNESRWHLLKDGSDCLYFDNPYFLRQEKHVRFRLIRGAAHLTTLLPPQQSGGRSIYTPPLEPWRTDGKGVLVIPPSDVQIRVYDAGGWLEKTMTRLHRSTGRNIVIKENKKHPLEDFLPHAFAVVTFGSVAGVEAAVAGVPVFSGPLCPTLPISAGEIEDIETPKYLDRRDWARSLASACWTVDDLKYLDLENYNYAYRHDGQ